MSWLTDMYSSTLFAWMAGITAIICALGFILWKYMSRNDNYWKEKGVPYAPRSNIFSAIWALRDKDLSELLMEGKQKYGSLYGLFELSTPSLSVAEPDLLKDILVKDFNIFSFRRDLKLGDPVTDCMVSVLKGEDWKRVRTIITPAFTSKRMRQMSSIINECSKAVADTLEKNSETGDPVDFKSKFGAFTMDVIAASAFGTKIDTYSDPNNIFVQQAKQNFIEFSVWKILLFFLLPLRLIKLFRIGIFSSNAFFKEMVTEVIKERKAQKKRYNDVLQIFMDAVDEQEQEKNSELNVDEEDLYGSIVNKGSQSQLKYKTLSQNELLAQCALFFFVGFETSASILTFLVYSLATNPEWQEKLIKEVDAAFEKHSEMSYDSVRGMKILDAVTSETLRMYPPLIATERTATEDYPLGDTGIVIEKGMRVSCAIYTLHYDPKYFEEPHQFKPERFFEPNFHPYAYLPFGAGPRNCLGMRLALLEIKLCLTNLLRRYRFRPHATTKVPVEFRKSFQVLTVSEMPLIVEKRTDV